MGRYKKILGSMTAAAIGDAMGGPMESRPVYLIKNNLAKDGFVYDYIDYCREDLNPVEFTKGTISDDFSISYASACRFVQNGGVSKQAAIDALMDWKYDAKYKKYSDHFMGPTTRAGYAKLEGNYIPDWSDTMECCQSTITNGGAMKSWVCGLFNPGNLSKAIEDAITMSILTHDNIIALSGAAAVAAGVSMAMTESATLDQVIDAGIYGAGEGYLRAKKVARHAAGGSVEKRIGLAVEIGLKYSNDFEACVNEMTDIIGTGLFANEAVPAAFGFLASTGGDPMNTIFRAINAGNDTDTVACIAGSIAGALRGFDAIPNHHLPFLEKVNNLDIVGLAKQIDCLL